jgi:hypothetical protein
VFDFTLEYQPDTATHVITTRSTGEREVVADFAVENDAKVAMRLAHLAYHAGRRAEGTLRADRLATLLAARPLAT